MLLLKRIGQLTLEERELRAELKALIEQRQRSFDLCLQRR
jgi:hypothetical protein